MLEAVKFLVSKLSTEMKSHRVAPGDHFLTAHTDTQVIDLEKYLPAPTRIRQKLDFATVEGLTQYLADFGDETTRLFGDAVAKTVTAHLDYHTKAKASHSTHTAKLTFRTDPDWLVWRKLDDRLFTQQELLNFLLDYADDFVTPEKAQVLELVAQLKVAKNVNIDSKVGSFDLNTVINADVSVKAASGAIPDVFTVKVAVLENFSKYGLQFRLVGQLDSNDKLRFKINLVRPHLVEQQAFQDACQDIVGKGYKIYGHKEEA